MQVAAGFLMEGAGAATGQAMQMEGGSAVFSAGWVQRHLVAASQGETEASQGETEAGPVVVDEVDSDFLAVQAEEGALLQAMLQAIL